ncbi:MAG: tRNA pseudouridine(38-40) synthase TruA [Lachnospiraceae bacterium]|nr:tRNA pseudouridine(38-40) synthase TruA [Lachnospiraceae bacterium]
MKNVKLTISYDGTKYLGWEHQPNTDMTIQGKLEGVVNKMVDAKECVEIIGAGRTDAGVHAKAMVCNMFIDTEMSEQEIKDYLNKYLPEDICVNKVSFAAERFHSRYKATGKTYCYTLAYGDEKPVFDRKYVWYLDTKPDINAMKQAAELLMGEHDFASFCSNPKMKKSTVRLVDLIDVKDKEKEKRIYLTFHGTGFLQHMVRILTGTLVEVGLHKRTYESMTELLDARDRKLAGVTAPAQGLCLQKVDYS